MTQNIRRNKPGIKFVFALRTFSQSVYLLGIMARKQCFQVCEPSGNMAKKQCFLVCPPSGNMAWKQYFLFTLLFLIHY